MIRSGCPYCGNTGTDPATSTRPRPDDQTIVKCDASGTCNGGHYMVRRGRSYPLDDKTNPDGDPLLRVVG